MRNCEHNTVKETLTPESPHYARIDCLDCGRFVRWVKHPANVARDYDAANHIALLKARNDLSEREREFVLSLDRQMPKLSPKQREWLESIWRAHS